MFQAQRRTSQNKLFSAGLPYKLPFNIGRGKKIKKIKSTLDDNAPHPKKRVPGYRPLALADWPPKKLNFLGL